MRIFLIQFLKTHPKILSLFWKNAGVLLRFFSLFVKVDKKTMLFCAFGGRKFDDSPRALYDEVCSREEFDDWHLIWAFVKPEEFVIPRGEKVEIDTIAFFKAILQSKVWISNSGMTRGIRFSRKQIIRVETWHGTPLKRIGGEEKQNSLLGEKTSVPKFDNKTIRCAQSNYDRDIYTRIWNADRNCFIMCDLPRNDSLLKYKQTQIEEIKAKLNIQPNKKIILYTPTYREYLIDENKNNYIAPPIDLSKWKEKLGDSYAFLIRAHYVVSAALNIIEDDFVKDVSNYPCLNDLYAISDMMISDYSSTFIDYSILDRPMLCFAYDLEEYEEKRGLYVDIEKELPCRVDKDEDALIQNILTLNYKDACGKTKLFHQKYAPYAGHASQTMVDEVIRRIH